MAGKYKTFVAEERGSANTKYNYIKTDKVKNWKKKHHIYSGLSHRLKKGKHNIGIKHGFSSINICQVPRDLANVNALKTHVRSLLLHKN